jgi:hypothetical protein
MANKVISSNGKIFLKFILVWFYVAKKTNNCRILLTFINKISGNTNLISAALVAVLQPGNNQNFKLGGFA